MTVVLSDHVRGIEEQKNFTNSEQFGPCLTARTR